jgi:hypothetical protein
VTLPLLVIFGLATGPPAGVGDGLRFIPLHALTTLLSALGRFVGLNPAVLGFVSAIYGAFVQIMETQVNALTTLLSALGAFGLGEFRGFSTNLNILRSICSDHGDPAQRAAAPAAPDGSPRSYPRSMPPAASGQ